MTLDEQQQALKSFASRMEQTLLKKGNDYAALSDRLSNFKLSGAICNLTAEQVCLSLIATKVSRLGNLLGANLPPDNESIDDSLLDLANYAVLLHMLLLEKQQNAALTTNHQP